MKDVTISLRIHAMTPTILSIVLLVIATASTLTAFDGKEDGRITTKGWLALCFVILTFGFGVSKEIYSYFEGKQKDTDAALKSRQDQIAASARQTELKAQLAATRGELELADAKLGTANAKLELAGTQLENLRISLGIT
jgi:hypothetical protein